jgi:hypothetical protein
MEVSVSEFIAAPSPPTQDQPELLRAPGRQWGRAVLLQVLIIAILVRLARRRLQAREPESETGPDSTSGGSLA